MDAKPAASWWGEVPLPEPGLAAWRICGLQFVVRRTQREWNFAHRWDSGVEDPPESWEKLEPSSFPEEDHELARFVFVATGDRLTLAPALADRPVVTSPRIPLFLSPGEETLLLVGSPLWLQARAEDETLRDLPIHRPSDTWFGPSTREGELCYAARTRAVLDYDNLPFSSRRAITPVRIRNAADVPLELDRLKLPVPHLSLHAAPSGRLWTETVTLQRGEASEMADVTVQSGAPDLARRAKLVAGPRQPIEQTAAMRVFSSLLRATGMDHD